MKKVYVTRKYILAHSAQDAIKQEKKYPVDDCWIEENSSKEYIFNIHKYQKQ